MLWRLKKALYGLKNSPRLWQDLFAEVMSGYHFMRTKCDSNLYAHDSLKLYVVCYVDDFLMIGEDDLIVSNLQELSKELYFRVKQVNLTTVRALTFLEE